MNTQIPLQVNASFESNAAFLASEGSEVPGHLWLVTTYPRDLVNHGRSCSGLAISQVCQALQPPYLLQVNSRKARLWRKLQACPGPATRPQFTCHHRHTNKIQNPLQTKDAASTTPSPKCDSSAIVRKTIIEPTLIAGIQQWLVTQVKTFMGTWYVCAVVIDG